MKACLPSIHIQRPRTSNGFSNQLRVPVFTEKKINRKDYNFSLVSLFSMCLWRQVASTSACYMWFIYRTKMLKRDRAVYIFAQAADKYHRIKMVSRIFHVYLFIFLASFFLFTSWPLYWGKKSIGYPSKHFKKWKLGLFAYPLVLYREDSTTIKYSLSYAFCRWIWVAEGNALKIHWAEMCQGWQFSLFSQFDPH